ncbi:hypothetical protein MD484_g571, partial [Candolleomyces efflorescens]
MSAQNQPLHPSFVTLYRVEDILTVVAQWLPWGSLNLLAFWPAPGPSVSWQEKRRRVFDAISPFVSRTIASDFFRELESCQGLITGSVVRHVLRSGLHEAPYPPFDLNIIVPKGVGNSLRVLLRDNGYIDYDRDPPRDLALSIVKVELFEKWHEGLRKRLYITIATARKSTLHALVSSRSTADMNAISGDTVYSFYPRTTLQGEGLEVMGRLAKEPGGRQTGKDVVLSTRNDHWTRSCGVYCPMMHRKTYQDQGVARYRWSYLTDGVRAPAPSRPESLDDLFNRDPIEWQVNPVCHNPKCSGMALYDFRRSYLSQ